MTRWITVFILLILMSSFVLDRKDERSLLPKEIRNSFVYIPGGFASIEGETVSVSPFFLSMTEVSNREYRSFLSDLQGIVSDEAYRACIWDTTRWRDAFAFNEPYVEYYHKHSAYDNYPAVNITRQGAEMYCEWLENRLNNANEEMGVRYEVSLPSRRQWLFAAMGSNMHSVYAWGGSLLRNKQGCLLCNFYSIGPESIHKNEETGEYEVVPGVTSGRCLSDDVSTNADITVPVRSFSPHGYGLYNMNGNVAELVSDIEVAVGGSWRKPGYDVRNVSVMPFLGPSPEVGFRPMITILTSN